MPDVSIGSVASGSSNLRGYLARPAGAGPWPAVLAIHEIFGVTDDLRRQVDRLAAAGFLTLGVDLYSDGGFRRCVVSTVRDMIGGNRDGRAMADIAAARAYLAEHADSTGKVGVIGFCLGGGFALLAAGTGFDAAAPNYGQLPKNAEQVLAGACPIVASYGGRDVSLRGAAAKLDKTLTRLQVPHDVKEYPAAGHSFLNQTYFGPAPLAGLQRVIGLGPEPEAAADAWSRIESFFDEHLGS